MQTVQPAEINPACAGTTAVKGMGRAANLISAYVAYGALVIQPQGVWGESTLTGIEFASALLIMPGVVTSLIAPVPARSRPGDRAGAGRVRRAVCGPPDCGVPDQGRTYEGSRRGGQ